MQIKAWVLSGIYLAVCLGLAGCTTERPRRSQPLADLWQKPLSYLRATERAPEASDDIALGAGGEAAAEPALPQPTGPDVEFTGFESPGTDTYAIADRSPSDVAYDASSLRGPAPLPPDPVDEIAPPNSGGVEGAGNVCRVDLSTALEVVSGRNPRIAFASQRYREAYAQLRAARVLWLPSIRAGVSYNKHEGVLQGSDGLVFDSSRNVLQSGLGVRSVGTGSPPVPGLSAQFHMSDAVFQPRIANRAAAARQEAARAATNDVLFDTALAYLDLLKANQERAIAEETLTCAQQLADLTATFARTGQGSPADADRARAALAGFTNRVTQAEEDVEVSAARLNQLLRFEPGTVLLPSEPTVLPVELVSREEPVGELVATGLSNRPELAESRHLVGEAVHRYRREKYAPLLPSAFLGVSYGGFGGGRGSEIEEFRDRLDFDAAAYWEVRNLGFGEHAAREETRAQHQQARLQNIQIMDRVACEVIEAHAQIQARHRQIGVAESGIQAATDSYHRNMARIRAGEGLPIEVLQSIQALDQARREYLRAVVDHNEAQFRLHRALGWPIQ